jgi:D-aminopeptidase
MSELRPRRARQQGIAPGVLPPGALNAITDVSGVCVGHFTLVEGDDVRTGVTAIVPHGGNLFQQPVPAGLFIANGFGKMTGSSQLFELGELETPILLTNTLAVPRAADALLDWTLAQPGNENAVSINPVVGETNDGVLNNIRRRVLTPVHMIQALSAAAGGPVAEGCVGAGTGCVAFGWKAGIGTSSRQLPASLGGWNVGVLVQANFGGVLQILGQQVGLKLRQYYLKDELDRGDADGSIMIIVATDAPLFGHSLSRLANRAMAGLARTGASFSDGSGDYAIAFSTAKTVRRSRAENRNSITEEIPHSKLSPLFQACIEATEEAIYNSLFMATTTTGYRNKTIHALPPDWSQP